MWVGSQQKIDGMLKKGWLKIISWRYSFIKVWVGLRKNSKHLLLAKPEDCYVLWASECKRKGFTWTQRNPQCRRESFQQEPRPLVEEGSFFQATRQAESRKNKYPDPLPVCPSVSGLCPCHIGGGGHPQSQAPREEGRVGFGVGVEKNIQHWGIIRKPKKL